MPFIAIDHGENFVHIAKFPLTLLEDHISWFRGARAQEIIDCPITCMSAMHHHLPNCTYPPRSTGKIILPGRQEFQGLSSLSQWVCLDVRGSNQNKWSGIWSLSQRQAFNRNSWNAFTALQVNFPFSQPNGLKADSSGSKQHNWNKKLRTPNFDALLSRLVGGLFSKSEKEKLQQQPNYNEVFT